MFLLSLHLQHLFSLYQVHVKANIQHNFLCIKVEMSWNTSSSRFCLWKTFLAIGYSLCLKARIIQLASLIIT